MELKLIKTIRNTIDDYTCNTICIDSLEDKKYLITVIEFLDHLVRDIKCQGLEKNDNRKQIKRNSKKLYLH